MTKQALIVKLSPWLFTIGLFIVWEAAVRIFHIPEFFLPPPTAVAQAFVEFAGPLARNSWITLETTLIGFALAVGFGLLLGLLVGWSRTLCAGLHPPLLGVNATPQVAPGASIPGSPEGTSDAEVKHPRMPSVMTDIRRSSSTSIILPFMPMRASMRAVSASR